MICYQDEKMYGPPINGMTEKELDIEIKKLEMKIYGEQKKEAKNTNATKKHMIYDVNLGKLV